MQVIADDSIGLSFYVRLNEAKLINLNFKGMVTDKTIFSENSDLKLHAGISANDVLASDTTQNMIRSGGVWSL